MKITLQTYFFRSNTEMRFPTGLTRLLPSEVNTMLPLWYTQPTRLENWKKEIYHINNITSRDPWKFTGSQCNCKYIPVCALI
jgi:hypothetical protein